IELNEVKCSENPSKKEIENVIEKEGLSILKKLNSNNPYVITLCIEGSIISSENFAKELEKSHTISGGTIYFIIGGSFGLCENVKKISSLKLSFSKMTFTHQMARIILMEQIYRGFQINSNGKYHK
ncbi:MAG: 23S rRNA (pseudouridine(1915)-N(3))-methyltransferase RlmH, partial [Oscillospiraceae bacterium]